MENTKINALSLEDFMGGSGRLNLESFTNLEKGMKESDFIALFPESAFEIFNEEQLSAFVANAQNEIIKGEAEGIVDMVKVQISTLNKFRVKNQAGEGSWMFVRKKSEADIEKSHIIDAFQHSDNFKFKKTGAEILEQMEKIKTEEESEKNAAKTKMILLQDKLTEVPTEEVGEWIYRGFKDKVGKFYRFPWESTRSAHESDGMHDKTMNVANLQQECSDDAKLKRQYNECVEKYIDACVEVCMIELYMNNITSTSSYDLTPRQAAVLQF